MAPSIADLTPTPSQTVGPFFHLGCTDTHSVSCIAGSNAKGERVRLTCRVLDGDGMPVDDAMIEIWQADSEGRYNQPMGENANGADPHCAGFGRLASDANGFCIFETIKPGRVPADAGKLQAPHLNVSVFARGVLKQLVTRIYFADEPANQECPILNRVPQERRSTLMARSDTHNPGDWQFVIHLCGKDETVFFDV
jgi:protocatechuate 3,4-dioxygenase, alpha subunit